MVIHTQRARPLRARRGRPSLQFERLEDRELLTVTYHGGPTLTAPQVESVFLGPSWSSDPTSAAWSGQVNGFLQMLVSSSFMDVLAPYGVGRGRFTGSANVSPPDLFQAPLTDSSVQGALADAIHSGQLSYNSQSMYAVYLPQNVEIAAFGETSGLESSTGHFSGYHNSFVDPATGDDVRYSVTVWPGGVNQTVSPLSWEQLATTTTSHELAEAMTNPDPLTNPAWYDDSPPNPAAGDEVADIAWGNIAIFNGFAIQAIAQPNDTSAYPSGSVVVSAGSSAITARPKTSFKQTVAVFTDLGIDYSSGPRNANDFQATIAWGNGQTASGQVVQLGPGQFAVVAKGQYKSSGSFNVSVVIRDIVSNQSTIVSTTATVGGRKGIGGANNSSASIPQHKYGASTTGAAANPLFTSPSTSATHGGHRAAGGSKAFQFARSHHLLLRGNRSSLKADSLPTYPSLGGRARPAFRLGNDPTPINRNAGAVESQGRGPLSSLDSPTSYVPIDI